MPIENGSKTASGSGAKRVFSPERLRRAMKERGMSQGELEEATGIHANSISRYVCGHVVPRDDLLSAIASALDMEIDDLKGVVVLADDERHADLAAAVETVIACAADLTQDQRDSLALALVAR